MYIFLPKILFLYFFYNVIFYWLFEFLLLIFCHEKPQAALIFLILFSGVGRN